jgi:precorrin-6Y C5,15-methyltransferase (decarboxylating)
MLIVYVIGIGPGSNETLTKEAEEAIKRSTCLIGDKRVLAPFRNLNKPVFYSSNVQHISEYLKSCGPMIRQHFWFQGMWASTVLPRAY